MSKSSMRLMIGASFFFSSILVHSPAGATESGDMGPVDVSPQQLATVLQLTGKIMPPPAGIADIKFGEFFKMPFGPKGLEPTAKLLSLDGKRVRLIGYMVHPEEPMPGEFILSPLPVALAEKDDGPADDIPATSVFVHVVNGAERIFPHVNGLLQLTGTLSVGSLDEPDGRVSTVRLMVDEGLSREILKTNGDHVVSRAEASAR